MKTQQALPKLVVAHDVHRHRSTSAGVAVYCGWGRLVFGQTFDSSRALALAMRAEHAHERDIAMYVADPHIVLAHAPQELFLDPSHTFRTTLPGQAHPAPCTAGYRVRPLATLRDAEQVAAIYCKRRMVAVEPAFLLASQADDPLLYLVAEDVVTGDVIGTVTGVDHVHAFGDPENGCSLWALAVDPQTPHAGIGHALVAAVLAHFAQAGRSYLDLSVMHDNQQAISLYEKLGFERVPVFCVKRRNSFNEPLYSSHPEENDLRPHTLAIVREARRRGIAVDVVDPAGAYLSLTYGGRTVVCQDSLSELSSSIAVSRCQDVRVTRRMLTAAGLRVPAQIEPRSAGEGQAFLEAHGALTATVSRREPGTCVRIPVASNHALAQTLLGATGARVMLEQRPRGEDVRIVVIDHQVVAAAARRPPSVVGDGKHTLRTLIEKQSRRRAAATRSQSQIPLDAETACCVAQAGHRLDDVLEAGVTVVIRNDSDVATGATLHDVTGELHESVLGAARRAAEILDLPLVGLDFVLPLRTGPEYFLVSADARPDLSDHEPQPTVARYVDLLFPQTAAPADDRRSRRHDEAASTNMASLRLAALDTEPPARHVVG